MYGLNELKKRIITTSDEVVCPVCSCAIRMARQKKTFKLSKEFYCENHEIFVSPTAFAYKDENKNLIWHSENDKKKLSEIKKVKRESRMNYNNSEDALTWNVFRYLENANLLDLYFSKILNRKINNVKVIYWSYSSEPEDRIFEPLKAARNTFEFGKGSEPDIILVSNEMIIFVEAKFGASNNVEKKKHYKKLVDKYTLSENRFWETLFTKDFETIAVKEKKYELARFWLLGNWIATHHMECPKDFSLINLVRDVAEKNIEAKFSPLINQNCSRVFKRITWESIYDFIRNNAEDKESQKIIIDYFENRTLGYDKKGNVRKAFNI